MPSLDDEEESKYNAFKIKVVTGTGNARQGSMSKFPDEIAQAVLDVCNYFYKHAADLKLDAVEGVDDGIMAKCSKMWDSFPDALKAMLEKHDGGWYFYESKALSGKEILSVAAENADSDKWSEDYMPFAKDIDDNLLIIAGGTKVREWDSDAGCGETLAASFGIYFEKFRNQLVSNRLEYIEDCGLVECMAASPQKRVGKERMAGK